MKKIFGDKEFIWKLIGIALPLALQSVVNLMVNLIDTIMVGKLGDIALSSVNICSQFPYLYMTVFMGIANAALVICSQAWGNNRPDKVKTMMAACLKLAALINAVFFLLAFLFPSGITAIYTDNAGIIETGGVYLKILSFTLLFQSFSQIIVTLLRSVGVTRLGFVTSLFSCIANVFFNWMFIFGNLGAPAMGVSGAAVGTVIARILEFVMAAGYLLIDGRLSFRLPDLFLKMEKEMRSDFIKLGTPGVISEVTGNLNVSAAAMITGRVSEYYIAANTIVHNIWTISSLFMFGIAMGSSVIIGHEIGAGRRERAREYADHLIYLAGLIGLLAAVLIQIIAPLITSFFDVSAQAKETAFILKNAASICVFFLSMQFTICKGILRGGGQAAAFTKVDLITCWLINIPAGFVTALVLHANPFWIYLSLRIDYLIKTIWGLWKVKKTDWIIRLNVE